MKAHRAKLAYLLGGAVIIALAVFNLLLLQQNQVLEKDVSRFSGIFRSHQLSSSSSPLLTAGSQPLCFTFVDPKSQEAYQPRLTLIVFFSPHDCVSCLGETSVWEELEREYGPKGLKVLGMVCSDDHLATGRFADAEGLSFPIVHVDSVYMKNRLGIAQTPFKVLLDSTLTVVYLNGPNSESLEQLRFKAVIERWCALSL